MFCGMCCNYHIGLHLVDEFNYCSMQCETITLGDLKKDKVKAKTDNKDSKAKGTVRSKKSKSSNKRTSKKSRKKKSTSKQMKKFFKDV
jgi:hypothetical protein